MEPVYLVTKVRQKLATDPRVGLTDVLIHIPEDGHVVVSGYVSTPEQKEGIDEVLRELPEVKRISNKTHVREVHPTHHPEIIGRPGGEK